MTSGEGPSTPQVHGVKGDVVPAPAVRRLSLYLREMEALLKRETYMVSSKQLGQLLGITDAQVRKDLTYFGQFGHPGIGYHIPTMITRIKAILGTDRNWNAILVGAGNLGRALLSYRGFGKKGFSIVAVFDSDPKKHGQRIGADRRLEIKPIEQLAKVVRESEVQVAILSVPAEVAQSVADTVVAAGVKGILNFAPTSISLPESVAIDSVDLAVQLEQLAFRISVNQLALQPE